ncbi:MAG: ABC transporter substrate-binding protein [Gammaproteobacteria bacterium WSBS_2016_MAG_OTU1]
MKHASFSRRAFLTALGTSAVAAGFRFPANAAESKELSFYNWDTYIGETTLADFKSASGIDVRMDLFGDNSELFAKMREGNPGYDLIVPTNDFVERMWRAGLLQSLDHSKIPNFRKNIASIFQDAGFDPGRKYSMPYMWGTMGIGYRKSKVKSTPTSWSAVWGEQSAQYAGKIGWISEPSSMMGMVMRYLGHSFNSEDPAHIRQAADQLIKFKDNVKGIFEDNGQDLLASGEVDLTVEWSGDIAQLISEDDDIGYVIPDEGGYFWQDCLCIPEGAPHPQNAHAFIDFLLGAEIGRDLADYIQYATPNEAARLLMPDSYRNNSAIYPPEAVQKNLEPSLYLGEDRAQLIDAEWTRVLAT